MLWVAWLLQWKGNISPLQQVLMPRYKKVPATNAREIHVRNMFFSGETNFPSGTPNPFFGRDAKPQWRWPHPVTLHFALIRELLEESWHTAVVEPGDILRTQSRSSNLVFSFLLLLRTVTTPQLAGSTVRFSALSISISYSALFRYYQLLFPTAPVASKFCQRYVEP